ncbi:hypothetical protein CO612_09080 [Lysobacteraceae bacterium NML71-0210]|nr:hypothetical protein CO612_09080 [Xanthomonadaceae bacterium NML71-0210]
MPRSARYWLALMLATALLVVLGWGYRSQQLSRPAPALPPAQWLEVGDWVFRSGTSQESLLIRQLSHSRYSHIGMVVETSPEVWVVHATTDDDPARPDQVLLSTLTEFAAAEHAEAIAVARPRFLSREQRIQTALHMRQRVGERFVLAARNKPHRYCTTLLRDAIRTQQADFELPWYRLDIALFEGEYLMPQRFAEADIQWVFVADTPSRQ